MIRIVFVLLALIIFPKSFSQDFDVDYCKVDIYIHKDGYFDVVENYDLRFKIPKHGIYRNIQTNYKLLTSEGEQETRRIKISDIEVPGYKFEAPFSFEQKLSDNLQIKIGDANVTLVGPQHYEIKYRVTNAFLHEDNRIVFYWNIKPDGWWAVFKKIDFTIHLPEGISLGNEDIFVYSGNTGTEQISTEIGVSNENGVITARSFPNFVSYAGQSVTVLVNLPPNSVKEIKPLWPFWTQHGWLLVIGALLTGFYLVWRRFGKDDRVIAASSYYPPQQMDPAMAGYLINDREDTSDLISLIPYWGSKGIITMQEIPKKNWFSKSDTKLTRINALPENAPLYEQKIFKGLFGSTNSASKKEVLVSSLKDSFYTTMTSAKTILKKEAQQYYEPKSEKVKKISLAALILWPILLVPPVLFMWGVFAAVMVVVTCVFLLFMNNFMAKKNAKGNKVLSELKGFKRFIKVSEQGKLKMLLQDDPAYFETTMGYALAFNMFDKWAAKFDALNVQPPEWYSSTSYSSMNMNNFSQSFSSSMSSARSTMVSSPSSSSSGGGGSSGGGFGGGGGGSW
ncbi:MAG: DUF2207 domain-containing protein [Altibacter sp.]|uniref:DUF2207 domain-containing protein n=1 Tax=Altibacter sp. TaxID=2024823 RepID=UPI001DFA28F6|nr:DUF2207 domain-containing protein [Altibacter sp.]MBZ0327162.1 DUF2207 domain-containing protein [Altibacter sp.]